MSGNQTNPQMDVLLSSVYPPDGSGGVVLVMKDGEVLHRKAYGMANLELGVKLQPESVLKIGSVTKQFTAVGILLLAEQGKLSLDDLIEKHLPGYPTHGHTITIEHLLTHTSGIKSYTNLPEWAPTFGKDYIVEALIDLFKYKPMDFAPGQRFLYNNSAYFLLGAIIARVSGQAYEEFLHENIFDPLGMRHTYGYTGKEIIPLRAAGYEKSPQGVVNCPYLSMTHPGGVLSSTVDDLAKWDAALYTEKLINRESLQRAWTPYTLANGSSTHYGYGWAIEDYEGETWLGHGGGIPGFVCDVLRAPGQRLFAAVLANHTGADQSPDTLAFKLALLALGKSWSEPLPAALPAAEIERIIGPYVDADGDESIIKLVDGKLTWGDASGEHSLEANMISSTEMMLKREPLNRVKFLFDSGGKATGFAMINQFGRVTLTGVKKEE